MRTSSQRPLILVTPDTELKGEEMADRSSSLSEAYQKAVLAAGGIPVCMPATIDRQAIAACVQKCDGVLLTGGNDVNPEIYGRPLPPRLGQAVTVTPDGGQRDFREIQLVDEVFLQRKPLMAICRGLQVLNVALGGTLLADIPLQKPKALVHRRMDKKREIVHQVRLTPDSLVARIVGGRKLGVNSTHHQAVEQVAPPLRPVAFSPDGIIEGLELKHRAGRCLPFLLAVQFHPERLVDRYPEHQALFDAFAAACCSRQV